MLKYNDYVYLPSHSLDPLQVFPLDTTLSFLEQKGHPLIHSLMDTLKSQQGDRVNCTFCVILNDNGVFQIFPFDKDGYGYMDIRSLYLKGQAGIATSVKKVKIVWPANDRNHAMLSEMYDLPYKNYIPQNSSDILIKAELKKNGYCLCRVASYKTPTDDDPLEVITGYDESTKGYITGTGKKYTFATPANIHTGTTSDRANISANSIITDPQAMARTSYDAIKNIDTTSLFE